MHNHLPIMANAYIPDIELLQLLRSDDPTAHESAFLQLSEDPSVQARMEAILAASGIKNVSVAFLKERAFQSLREKVNGKKFKENTSLVDVYVVYMSNLLEVLPILMGVEPQSGQILDNIYCDATVRRTIRGWIKRHSSLIFEDILHTGIEKFVEAVEVGRFKGQCHFKTYFLSICWRLIVNSLKKMPIDSDFEDETHFLEKSLIFSEPLEFLGDVFTQGVDERNWYRDEFNNYVNKVFNQITEICRKTLILEHIEERSKAEIMAIMNIALSTAKNQKSRCKEQFERAINALSGLKDFLRENYGKY